MSRSDLENSSRIRLLEAAIFCFAEKGFDGTGIRDIALRAKANSALVQYHFGGKTGLYAEVLRYIFTHDPVIVPELPADTSGPEAKAMAARSLGELVANLLQETLHCAGQTEVDKAAMVLLNRELQAPREDMVGLIMEHLRPYVDHVRGCLRILRPDLGAGEAMDFTISILGQMHHMHEDLAMVRLIRDEPDYPQDLQALSRHILRFCLHGLALPEAILGAES